ncbi:hypothetical protein [Tenacibaculum sp. MAR_2009_124]|nr:hypothetical protein [Tenacibaculum sp. MAR_2009_124]
MVDYEITVSKPKTTGEFIGFLRDQGFKGNVATNTNYPGKIWLGTNTNDE